MGTYAFKKRKKDTMTAEFEDQKLTLGVPTKEHFDEYIELAKEMNEMDQSNLDIDVIYRMVTLILNTNTAGRTFTQDEAEAEYDLIDATEFLNVYTEFAQKVQSQKN